MTFASSARHLLVLAALAPYIWTAAACGSSDDPSDDPSDAGATDAAATDASLPDADAQTPGQLVDANGASDAGDGAPPQGDAGDGSAPAAVETGLYVVTDVPGLTDAGADGGGSKLAQLLARSYVHGVSLDLSWADLEPTQGVFDGTVLVNALASLRAAAAGRSLTVKIHLRNGVPPGWVTAGAPDPHTLTQPQMFVGAGGFEMLALPSDDGNESVQLVPTDAVYQAQVRNNIAEIARQLEVADPANLSDPNAQLVKIVQFSGPSAAVGGTVRLEYTVGFPGPDSGADAGDAYGLGFTYPAFLQAWTAAATFFATDPSTKAFRSRLWTFDITTEVQMGSAFSLSVASQQPLVAILEGAHPLGAAGVRLMDESLGVDNNTPDYPATPDRCSWMADRFTDITSDVPVVASRPLHEWQLFVVSKLPATMPRFDLARNALFVNPESDASTLELQHTQFVEIHDEEVTGDGKTLPDQSGPAGGWYSCLDSMIRSYAPPARTLSSADQAFWATVPPAATASCGTAYPPTPAAGTCAPP